MTDAFWLPGELMKACQPAKPAQVVRLCVCVCVCGWLGRPTVDHRGFGPGHKRTRKKKWKKNGEKEASLAPEKWRKEQLSTLRSATKRRSIPKEKENMAEKKEEEEKKKEKKIRIKLLGRIPATDHHGRVKGLAYYRPIQPLLSTVFASSTMKLSSTSGRLLAPSSSWCSFPKSGGINSGNGIPFPHSVRLVTERDGTDEENPKSTFPNDSESANLRDSLGKSRSATKFQVASWNVISKRTELHLKPTVKQSSKLKNGQEKTELQSIAKPLTLKSTPWRRSILLNSFL